MDSSSRAKNSTTATSPSSLGVPEFQVSRARVLAKLQACVRSTQHTVGSTLITVLFPYSWRKTQFDCTRSVQVIEDLALGDNADPEAGEGDHQVGLVSGAMILKMKAIQKEDDAVREAFEDLCRRPSSARRHSAVRAHRWPQPFTSTAGCHTD